MSVASVCAAIVSVEGSAMACKTCGDPQFDSRYNCHLCDIKRGRFQWCVITHGPTEKDGNQFDDLVSFEDTDVEYFDGKNPPRVLAEKGSDGFIHFKNNVFEVGEMFPVGKDFGRELCGAGRKPSKWDIGYVLFSSKDYKKAIALAIKSQKEKSNLEIVEQKLEQTEELTEKQQKVRRSEDPFKLIYGWIKQGHVTLKESKELLGEVFKHEQKTASKA